MLPGPEFRRFDSVGRVNREEEAKVDGRSMEGRLSPSIVVILLSPVLGSNGRVPLTRYVADNYMRLGVTSRASRDEDGGHPEIQVPHSGNAGFYPSHPPFRSSLCVYTYTQLHPLPQLYLLSSIK
jgi:hypothetical protein